MQKVFPSNKKSFSLSFNVRTPNKTRLKIQAFDSRKPYSFYYKTSHIVDPSGKDFNLTFPLSPNEMVVRIYPDEYDSYKSYLNFGTNQQQNIFISNEKVEPLKVKPIWLSEADRSFLNFAEKFATNASLYSATQPGGIPSIYKSDDGRFTIKYYDIIRNKDGTFATTPARIGQVSGDIEVSKRDFLRYTIPGRMAILLHEYAHKYINQRTGAKPSDESRADINAMNIYLSMGYSPIEALLVFLDVFDTANTRSNQLRYLNLREYVGKFMKGELPEYYKAMTKRAY
jgi:hypothetical protein